MKNPRSGSFNRRIISALAVTAALFVPLAVFGGPALARTVAAASQYEYSGSSQYQYKVTICHRTHSQKHPWVTITVSSRAVHAHLHHGDVMPPCPTSGGPGQQQPGSGSTSGSQTGEHGNSGNHGNSGDHGNSRSHGNGHGDGQGNGNSQGHGHGK
jgi:hypothetical protein